MSADPAVSHEEWLVACQALLEREKAFTRERDALSAALRPRTPPGQGRQGP
jgi:predicted dithiol-disulfide oxidoreductase (DUF899 family)